MNCGKSERKSRRSSILKTPKARRLLENAEPVESSGESSPETTKKIKRRVSFAEKKHVKEFCDLMEQGTVWDNTYEESELSQRNSNNSISDDNQLSCLHSQVDIVRETIVTSVEFSHSSSVISKNCRVIEDAERVPFPIDNLGSSKTAGFPSSSDGNEISEATKHRTNGEPPPAVVEDNCNDVVPMDETIIEAPSAVLTMPILTSKDVAHDGSSIAITPNTLLVNVDPSPKAHGESNDEELVTAKESAGQATFTVFHDDSMEMTEAISDFSKFHRSAKSIIAESKEESASITAENPIFQIKAVKFSDTAKDRTEVDLQSERTIFHDKSMDFTEAVPMIQNIEPSRISLTPKTMVFHNQSMDFTNVIDGLSSAKEPEKTMIFQNETVDFTRVVGNVACIGKSQEPPPERTTIFHNESLELTEVAPSVGNVKKSIFDNSESKDSEAKTERISQNIESIELPEPILRMSGVSKSISHGSIHSFNETIANHAKSRASEPREPIFEDTDSEIRSPLPKRLKSLGENSHDVTAAQTRRTLVNVEKQQNPIVFDGKATSLPEITPKLSILESASVLESGTREITERQFSEKTNIFHDQSMEMTSVVPVSFRCVSDSNRILPPADSSCFDALLEDCADRNDGNASVMAANATLLNDESMEMTCAIPGIVQAIRYNVEENPMIPTIADQSMEMTVPVSAALNAIAVENCIPDCVETKTTVFCDESMDLTKAVQYPSQLNRVNKNERQTSRSNTAVKLGNEDGTVFHDVADKENCPVGAEDRRSCRAQIFYPREANVLTSKNEFVEMKKSEESPSSIDRRKEMAVNYGSEDITGVVPFLSEIEEAVADEDEKEIFQEDRRSLPFGNVEMEITGVAPWPSNPSDAHSPNYSSDSPPLHRPPDRATLSPAETIHRRSGQVAKELFQKTISNERTSSADLEAVIKKINYNFAVEDASGFDQATFLIQQARCMEDYEANSTASQESNTATASAKMDLAATRIEAEFARCDSPKFNETVNSVAIGNVSMGDNNNFSSKSLEELRCRAETIGKYRVESTMTFEDLRAIEPPSIALEDSVTIDRSEVPQCALSARELSEDNIIFGKNTDRRKSREANEMILREMGNVPNVSFDIPAITSTQTIHMERIVNDKENEGTGERMERKMALIATSSSEGDNETTKNCRLSNTGVTTATEFTSGSPDGPSEKLRRRESVEEIEGKDEQLENLSSRWECEDFENSKAIRHHSTRQSIHRSADETSLILENSPSDELPPPFPIVTDDERNINQFVDPNPFCVLKETVEHLAARFETIWTINRLDEKIAAFNFFSDSIVVAVYFNEDEKAAEKPIKVIGFLSQLVEEGTDPGVSLAHSLIMKKISSASLTNAYRTYEDIPRMLEFVTTEVKLAMDFMFELNRLRNCNVMEIHGNRIHFLVRTRDINAGIIFKIIMEIKPFEEINCNDITLSYILGNEKVRENDIKGLITNVKRDHSFLRCYINDVKDYVDLMAETGFSTSSETSVIIQNSISSNFRDNSV